jgi:hypothetical protein
MNNDRASIGVEDGRLSGAERNTIYEHLIARLNDDTPLVESFRCSQVDADSNCSPHSRGIAREGLPKLVWAESSQVM